MVYLDQIVYTYFLYHCPATGMQIDDEALPNIISAGRGLLVKMLIIMNRMVCFYQILHAYTFKHFQDNGMQNGYEASPSISPAVHGQLVKTRLITLELQDKFCLL